MSSCKGSGLKDDVEVNKILTMMTMMIMMTIYIDDNDDDDNDFDEKTIVINMC